MYFLLHEIQYQHVDIFSIFDALDGKSCRWVRNKPVRRQNQCAREEVRVNCPQSCGLCCMDDPFYSFTANMVKERDCTWLGRIDTVERNGMVCFVEDFCQVCVRWCLEGVIWCWEGVR